MIRNGLLVALGALALGCAPDLGDRPSSVEGTRILAVRSEPAELAPNKEVHYEALVVDPAGTREDSPVDWAFCTKPRPLADLNDASSACFVLSADYLIPLGTGLAVDGKIPKNACRQFGPDVPEAEPGGPPGRPADPDSTGGYSQPVRLILPEGGGYVLGLGDTRLSCGLGGATSEAIQAYRERYRPNENPELTEVDVVGPTRAPLAPDGEGAAPFEVARGARVVLRASWPSCPSEVVCGDGICGAGEDVKTCAADCTAARGCKGPEPYVYYDPESRTVADRREGMRVSWFATAGGFDEDRTGIGEDEPAGTSTDNAWTAPDAPGDVHLWVVLRDTRGGIDWHAYTLRVR